jgi:hypothetical protein
MVCSGRGRQIAGEMFWPGEYKLWPGTLPVDIQELH